ncbi:MAG: homoserine dehydrogenase [Hyphomicrobiaceae bacterium]|nr:homoserine dehydrogenase [Hyphomicrobiaceae bacterium]
MTAVGAGSADGGPAVRAHLAEALEERERTGRRVRVGLIGAGQMGTDILVQVAQMRGIEVVAAADVIPERIGAACALAGSGSRPARMVTDAADACASIRAGRLAATASAEIVCRLPEVEAVIDATGNPNMGARVALLAIEARKHIVMMNVEADVTAGAFLAVEAARAGVIYTLGAGDEPASTMELIRFVRALGYPVIAAGKGKNNPFIVDATPDDFAEEARRRNMNPRMLVEFVDGSKTMVEMVAIANATGLVPDVPGMHGPAAPREELHAYFCPSDEGGLLGRKGVVDFSVAKGVAPGVFVVTEMRHPRVRERMQDLHLGAGPYYAFFRPYHLTSLEVPLSAAAAVALGECHMRPLAVPSAEVGCLAKRDLEPGETLDALGEYAYRGFALTRQDAVERGALPVGLAQGARVARPIVKGELLTYAAVEPDPALAIVSVRRSQDEMVRRWTS